VLDRKPDSASTGLRQCRRIRRFSTLKLLSSEIKSVSCQSKVGPLRSSQMKTLTTSTMREKSIVKTRLQCGERSYYRPQCEQRLFSNEKLALTLMRRSQSFPSRNGTVSDFGVGLATRISQKCAWRPALAAPGDLFCERKICEIGVWAPVNLGSSPPLHPKPQPL
jgi:hypothetical protein